MKKNRRFFRLTYVVLIIGLFGIELCAEQNQLCKIFHHGPHKGGNLSDHALLEIGKVVFYFNKDPEVRLVSDKKLNDKKQLIFLFPATGIKNKECMAMLEALHSRKNQWYVITLEQIKHPLGLRCSIVFDPEAIEMTYDTFDSIGLYKGLVFSFYDKTLLDKMKDKGKPLTRMAANDIKPNVIIDCGHGGVDTGSIGCGELQEKDVTLAIGLKTAALLRTQDINVALTRDTDVFVPLDKRTRYLVENSAYSVFISLHANYAENPMAAGIETFCLSPPLLKRNFKTMGDYPVRLLEYIMCDKYKKSQSLAICLHHHVISSACQKNPCLIDRHVKHAVSQVLLGTVVPSVLIELGFLSNEYEAAFLQNLEYQRAIAKGIYCGLLDYFNNLKSLS